MPVYTVNIFLKRSNGPMNQLLWDNVNLHQILDTIYKYEEQEYQIISMNMETKSVV